MARREMPHSVFLRLENALQKRPLPWPKLRYQNITTRTCWAEFPDLNEEEMNVLIAELLVAG